jgi:hypothetical protein
MTSKMDIKIIYILNKKEKDTIDYPCLMVDEHYSQVILFHDNSKGIVIYSDDPNDYPVGYYEEDWNMDFFHPYEGKIILEN